MQTQLISLTDPREERKKQQLEKSIARKREKLLKIEEKVQLLKLDLDLIEHEYTVRVGRLILKDNQLDLDIIRTKNILSLIQEGKTMDEALEEVDEKFYSEELKMHKEEEEIEVDAQLFADRQTVDSQEAEEIKSLWKKVLFKFHPDLVSDPVEKKRREEIMIRINHAYNNNDSEALKAIENENLTPEDEEYTVERLEHILVDLENTIIAREAEYQMLKDTEWFGWKKKFDEAKITGKDIFLQLEKNLLDDILAKITLLKRLKSQVGWGEFI